MQFPVGQKAALVGVSINQSFWEKKKHKLPQLAELVHLVFYFKNI